MRMKVVDLHPENPEKWWGFFSLFIVHYFTFFNISHTSRQKDLCIYFCHIDRSRKSRPNTEYSIQECILFCLSIASRAEVFHWLVRISLKQPIALLVRPIRGSSAFFVCTRYVSLAVVCTDRRSFWRRWEHSPWSSGRVNKIVWSCTLCSALCIPWETYKIVFSNNDIFWR
jgi:hypothetical protein